MCERGKETAMKLSANGWSHLGLRVTDLALAVENPSQLEDMQRDLDAAGVRNNGVEEDPVTHRKYISFYDPDDIAWELYSVSPRPTA
jgi:catechol 2,3-dioxygenase-like lactoylglutathione lyase family enzyme